MAKHLCVAAAFLAAAITMGTGAFSASAAEAETTNNTAVVSSAADGTWEQRSGKYYYVLSDGSVPTGETEIDGIYYLFGYNGALKTDWQTVNGQRFYYDPATGTPVFGWLDYFDKRFYISQDAGKLTGFQEIDGSVYAFSEQGDLLTGLFTVDGVDYCTDTDGRLQAQLITTENGTYLTDENGIALEGWQDANGLEYYFDPYTHAAVFGLQLIDGSYYYLTEESGKLYGIQEIDGSLYPLDETTGELTAGWFSTEAGTHYFDMEALSELRSALAEIDGELYYFDENACMTTNVLAVADGSTYYFTEDGSALRNSMLEIDGVTYYFGEDGTMYSGWLTLDAQEYYFFPNGAMATGAHTIDFYACVFDENGVLLSKELTIITLDVPSYKQFDEEWSSEALGSSTIGKAGCLTTALAMLHSYSTSSEVTPVTMKGLLNYTDGGALKSWSDIENLGYTVETYESVSVTDTIMQKVLSQLQLENPVVMGCKSDSNGQHYVTITGYLGDGTSIGTELFTINDPGSSRRTLLSEFLALFPKLYKLIY